MKKIKASLFFLLFLGLTTTHMTSCKTGSGCEATEAYKAKTDKDGQLSTKRGKSGLFGGKKRRKRK